MVEFKVVLSDTKTGRAYNLAVTGGAAGSFVGKKIGDEVDGGAVGLSGYRMRITGGTDRVGTPARKDIPGMARRKILLSGGRGYHPVHDGERRRKSVRGSEITGDFVQINAVVSAWGEKPLAEQLGKPAGEKGKEAAEKPAAPEKKAEAKHEKKAEEKHERKPETAAQAPSAPEKKAEAHPAPEKKAEAGHEKKPEAPIQALPAPDEKASLPPAKE
jgi:small subunit ribosomal protein S6e